jgi:hypothetical protein
MEFVPEDFHNKALPCHQIPMNREGETIVSLKAGGDIARLEQSVLSWLRKKIAQIEQELSQNAEGPSEPAAV